jgi:NMT1/THI5 like
MTRRKFTVGVAIPRGMSAPYAYFTPAVALGYDRDEGLEFAFFYGGEPGSTARSLCQGACDIACLNTIVGFMGRAEGLPMLAIGSKARRAHRYFAVMPESPAVIG